MIETNPETCLYSHSLSISNLKGTFLDSIMRDLWMKGVTINVRLTAATRSNSNGYTWVVGTEIIEIEPFRGNLRNGFV